MTQPATVFPTDLRWWIQCKESRNTLGLVCLKMSVFSSLDLRQVFASTTWHIAMPTQGRSIRRWKQNPANRASGEFKAGHALRSIWPQWRLPIWGHGGDRQYCSLGSEFSLFSTHQVRIEAEPKQGRRRCLVIRSFKADYAFRPNEIWL